MVSEIMGGYGANLIIAVAAVAVALFLLFLVSRMLKNRGFAGRIRPGSGPRLAVLDSTPVDTSRRLVLIRRDDVEHLILIGGPSDLVIESRIERKNETSDVTVAAPAQRQRQSVAAATPPVLPKEAPASAASARPPIKTSASMETPPRQHADPAPPSRPAEAGRVNQSRAEERSASSASPITAAAGEAGRNIQDVLDDARGRVFGPSSGQEPVTPPASHHEESRIRTIDESKPSARFEDFLDAEVAGDLSAVTPGQTHSPASRGNAATHTESAKRESSSIDTDMERLLGELSVKR